MSDPSTDPKRHAYWGGRNKAGEPCGAMVIPGTKTCKFHGGRSTKKLRAQGQVVIELKQWGLTDATVDPGEVLLRLVTQSAARVELYSRLLQEAYEAAERLAEAHAAQDLVLTDEPDHE